jgi:hypothetical protein
LTAVHERGQLYTHVHLHLLALVGIKSGTKAHRSITCFPRFPAKREKKREPTSGLEPLTCSLRAIGQVCMGSQIPHS